MPSKQKEITTCYKCETEIKAYVGQVHPLCGECENDFDDWFSQQLKMFN